MNRMRSGWLVVLVSIMLLVPVGLTAAQPPQDPGPNQGDDGQDAGDEPGKNASGQNRSEQDGGDGNQTAQDRGDGQDRAQNRPAGADGRNQTGHNSHDNETRGPPDGKGRPNETGRPTWTAHGPPVGQAELPITFDGRYLSFTLDADGLRNLTVHGHALGDVPASIEDALRVHRAGAQLRATGANTTLQAVDAPAVQLRLSAANLSSTLPTNTTLASGATLRTTVDNGTLHVHVSKPADVLRDRTIVEHVPPGVQVQEIRGAQPGLRAEQARSSLGVQSETPGHVSTSFDGDVNGTQGAVSLDLALERALLIEDLDGDGRVDVGEPALAASNLTDGNTTIEDGVMRTTFPLWSGNLTLVVELGQDATKITYVVEGLQAPPGTLFTLENVLDAPKGSEVRPTPDGVVVRNGTLGAQFSAAGPVTVDDEPAWAHRSVIATGNGSVLVLVAYPAGDNITHDPTVAIQGFAPAAVTDVLGASPWAVAAGAVAAAGLVGATVAARRRGPD